jgi:hypothetical protein
MMTRVHRLENSHIERVVISIFKDNVIHDTCSQGYYYCQTKIPTGRRKHGRMHIRCTSGIHSHARSCCVIYIVIYIGCLHRQSTIGSNWKKKHGRLHIRCTLAFILTTVLVLSFISPFISVVYIVAGTYLLYKVSFTPACSSLLVRTCSSAALVPRTSQRRRCPFRPRRPPPRARRAAVLPKNERAGST